MVIASVKLLPSGDGRVDARFAHNIDAKLQMRRDVFKGGQWEIWVRGGEAGDEYLFECLNCALGIVRAVVTGRDKLNWNTLALEVFANGIVEDIIEDGEGWRK